VGTPCARRASVLATASVRLRLQREGGPSGLSQGSGAWLRREWARGNRAAA
jgi:hypothetical protein